MVFDRRAGYGEGLKTLVALIASAALSGACDGGSPPSDATTVDLDAVVGSTAPTCDPSAHVDCFFGVTCVAGVVSMSAHSPYPCCNPTECQRALAANICSVGRFECASGCGGPRRFGCNRAQRLAAYDPRLGRVPNLRDFCAEGGRSTGDRCVNDEGCSPWQPGPAGRLRCDRDAGVCVTAPLPVVPVGARCVLDEDCSAGMRCDCDAVGGGLCALAP